MHPAGFESADPPLKPHGHWDRRTCASIEIQFLQGFITGKLQKFKWTVFCIINTNQRYLVASHLLAFRMVVSSYYCIKNEHAEC